jgi:hypothetical protein
MDLCASVSEEGEDGEGTDSEVTSLLTYTLRYVRLTEVDTVCPGARAFFLFFLYFFSGS